MKHWLSMSSDHFALAGSPGGSCSSKSWFTVRKRHSAGWALAGHEDRHGFCFVPTVSPIWLMGLGFKCFIPRAFTRQVRSRPHCAVRVSLSTELFPWAMTTGWKFPLPSTSSLGTGVPSAEAANLKYEAWLSAVTSSTLGLTSTLT